MNLLLRNLILFLAAAFALPSDGYRMLAVFPFNGKSHNIMFEALMKGLARKGHQVDAVTHFPVKNAPEGYKTIINLAGTQPDTINNYTVQFAMGIGYHDAITFVAEHYGNKLCEILGMAEMQTLIKNPPNDPPYDVVITETFGANCFIGLGPLLHVPVIAVTTSVEYPWVSDFIGNNENLAVIPSTLSDFSGKMNFWERLINVISYYSIVHKFYHLTGESQTASMRKYLDPNMPNVREVERSIVLTLTNNHPSLYGSKPTLPSVVQVAGLHIEEDDAKLSGELQKWMDESTDGVVYFSLGSMVLIETLPREAITAIYASFDKIKPIRVLMKIADKRKLPPGLPKNILTSPWIPQIPILAHKNTWAFITHGGLMGIQEALYFGVPMIGIPIFADQSRNVALFVSKKMAVNMDINAITEKSLDASLKAILNDPSYRESAKYHSRLFRDRPMRAIDTAVFWTEYAVRNDPAILKSPALEYSWWQLALLDVYGFIFACIFITVCMTVRLVKLIYRMFTAPFTRSSESSKKRN